MSTALLLLAVVQGLAEFLPISSSGHLALLMNLVHTGAPAVSTALALHAGTLFAVLAFYRKDLVGALAGLRRRDVRSWRWLTGIGAAFCVTGVAGLALEPVVEGAFQSRMWLGGAFLLTAALLLLSGVVIGRHKRAPSAGMGVVIGLFQALALFPGVSRSGATLVAGLWCGLRREDALRFSFLLSVPTIGAASVLDMLRGGPVTLSPGLFLAMIVSFVVGYGSLRLILGAVRSGRLWPFAAYTSLLGLWLLL